MVDLKVFNQFVSPRPHMTPQKPIGQSYFAENIGQFTLAVYIQLILYKRFLERTLIHWRLSICP